MSDQQSNCDSLSCPEAVGVEGRWEVGVGRGGEEEQTGDLASLSSGASLF